MWRDIRDLCGALGMALFAVAICAFIVGAFYSIVVMMIVGMLRLLGVGA